MCIRHLFSFCGNIVSEKIAVIVKFKSEAFFFNVCDTQHESILFYLFYYIIYWTSYFIFLCIKGKLFREQSALKFIVISRWYKLATILYLWLKLILFIISSNENKKKSRFKNVKNEGPQLKSWGKFKWENYVEKARLQKTERISLKVSSPIP